MEKINNYKSLHNFSITQKEQFWKDYISNIDWIKKPTKILDSSKKPFYRWFPDAKMNITYNCLDRHAKKNPEKIAYYYEGPIAKEKKSITYQKLLEEVEQFSGVLKNLNLVKGDRVIIYMPMIIETPIAMLSCARLGLIHSVVFGGFSAQELSNRIKDSDAKAIISSTCGLEPHKIVDYPSYIREAKQISKNDSIQVVYLQRKEKKIELQKNEYFWSELMKKAERQQAVELDSNHPLYILYTSGTTGKPKGIYRGCGDTALGTMLSLEYGFGYNANSTMFATSDFGWVVGHSYMVYGPLLWGGTSIIYEGKPTGTPDVGAYFRIVEEYKVDILYSSPTAIRAIRKEDPTGEKISKYNISTLKVVGMVGERTDVHTYNYIQQIIPKKCLYNDTYWQTETGWFICANFVKPERFPTKGGSCTKPFPGFEIHVLSEQGQVIQSENVLGYVVIKLPLPPGFMLSVWGDDEMCREKYFKRFDGYYLTGDSGYFDKDGYLHIMTRTDDVIQVAGHRLSTAQMEEAVLDHNDIVEALVVGIEDSFKGEIPYAVVVMKKGHERDNKELFKELICLVRKIIGPVACLSNFSVVDKLPKTRSGKILRGTVRKILNKQKYDMPATIEDAETLKYIHQIADTLSINRVFNDFGVDQDLDMKKLKVE